MHARESTLPQRVGACRRTPARTHTRPAFGMRVVLLQDFESKDYNVKAGKGYWQLGRLGPDLETQELQAKVRICACLLRTSSAWEGGGGEQHVSPASSLWGRHTTCVCAGLGITAVAR